MRDFDPAAYQSGKNLFEKARKIRLSLPSLINQIADTVDMLGTARIDGMPKGSSSGNPMEERYLKRIETVRKMEDKRDGFRSVLDDCERIIENMELHNECYASDAAFLRSYYLCGKSEVKAAKEAFIAASYAHEKKEVALVHASHAARRLGIF